MKGTRPRGGEGGGGRGRGLSLLLYFVEYHTQEQAFPVTFRKNLPESLSETEIGALSLNGSKFSIVTSCTAFVSRSGWEVFQFHI